jgi:guanosine-3',5'-bis(diphosphate) 3'-pyrophosphohydrolase
MEWTDQKDKDIIASSLQNLLDHINQFLPHVCIETVKRAFEFANMAHFGQRRLSGEPYIIHPIEVAKILAELNLDTVTIISALMHDVIEDTSYTAQDIEDRFSTTEAKIVEGLTKLHKIENHNIFTNKLENLRRLLMAVAEDARVLLIKLADRLHNMRTLHAFCDHRKRTKIAKETIDIYAPLAERIGIHFFKNILYDMAFEVLYPHIRQSIIAEVDKLKKNSQSNINLLLNTVAELMKKFDLDVDVQGREKSPFSIWQKMEKKQIYFDQLSDIFAVRIITKKPLDCYSVLGVIHMHYKVIAREFIDYISAPKENGYQSIHTVMLIDNYVRFEVQIRTYDMHHISELGMAAHWIYKNEESNNQYHQEWLNKIRSILEGLSDSNDVISNVKLEMYHDQVFCFTPRGDIISLPKNATPLDFAFEVNINLGLYYSKALVNGTQTSITTQLQSGDQVEILTSDHIMINHHWYDIASTAKAKSEIQVYLNKKTFDALVFEGHLSLNDECEKYNIPLSQDKLSILANDFETNIEELLFKIGNGSVKIDAILKRLVNHSIYQKLQYYFKKYIRRNVNHKTFKRLSSLRRIAEIQFAYCCDPLFDKICIGIWNKKEKFVMIHSHLCKNIRHPDKHEELCHIMLSDLTYDHKPIALEIIIVDCNTPSLIFQSLTDFGLSQYSIEISKVEDRLIFLTVNLKLFVPQQLESLINRLKQIKNVIDITIV